MLVLGLSRFFLKSNTEVLLTFKQFKNMVELQRGFHIKVIRSNLGGEFRPFTKCLVDLGIVHRIICLYTYHQNSVVESKHRNIVELCITFLS